MIDRDFFFRSARIQPFGGRMTAMQTAGCNAIVDGWEARPEFTDIRWLAYMLATAKHETAHTMQPIEEYGKGAGHTYGVPDPVTGQTYYGRGYVQLTWKRNYQTMAALLGVDLVHRPELALDPMVAAQIMFEGMKAGLFTGVGLPKYFNDQTDDPVNARKIINGLDRAHEIANIHRDFLAALRGPPGVTRSLRLGDTGDDVAALQRALQAHGEAPGPDDGDFGPRTDNAVRSFQTKHGLAVDGIAGRQTLGALGLVKETT